MPTGKVDIKVDFVHESGTPGGPATISLHVNGSKVGEGKIDRQVPFWFGVECLDIGMDTLSPVSKSYPEGNRGFPSTGTIEHVTFNFGDDGHEPSGHERLAQATRMN